MGNNRWLQEIEIGDGFAVDKNMLKNCNIYGKDNSRSENVNEASVDTKKWSEAFMLAQVNRANKMPDYKTADAAYEKFWKDFLKGSGAAVAKRVFRTFQVLKSDRNARSWESIFGIELDKRG